MVFETLVQVLRIDGFAQGFIIGQIVSLICFLFFVRYFLLASPTSYVLIKSSRSKKLAPQSLPVAKTDTTIDAILRRACIENKEDVDESCGWLNLLLARLLFAQLHEDPDILRLAIERLEETVATSAPFIKGFNVVQAELTPEEVPCIEGFRLKKFFGVPLTLEGSPSTYCLEGRLHWRNAGHFEVEAAAALIWPGSNPLVMLPCSISVKFLSVDALVRIALPDRHSTMLEVSLVPDQFSLELEIESSIGHRSKLRNVEKVSQLLAMVIRRALEDGLVWPNRIPVQVPKLSDLMMSEEQVATEPEEFFDPVAAR